MKLIPPLFVWIERDQDRFIHSLTFSSSPSSSSPSRFASPFSIVEVHLQIDLQFQSPFLSADALRFDATIDYLAFWSSVRWVNFIELSLFLEFHFPCSFVLRFFNSCYLNVDLFSSVVFFEQLKFEFCSILILNLILWFWNWRLDSSSWTEIYVNGIFSG